MAYEAFDPRKAYRENLGTQWDANKDGNNEYCITVTDKTGDTIYIPMYISEEVKSEDLPEFPYCELEFGDTEYEPHDIGASTRKVTTLITIHIYFTDTDNIDRTEFAKKIKNELHDMTRNNQSTVTGITFMNIEREDFERETDGRQVVYHYMAILYCLYYDLC